ncbi:hypothetical protein ILUMI_15392 [Ignelater luminosus]|uniref:Electron transfer flavoprotein subunit alpha n=1 Tax=Ignelater luminosus TaxID=2038154 RepID=A0A8K0CSC8_IGNLU|nr:hypothetical protein ILUMI_15392 [Ignelater luminosus]
MKSFLPFYTTKIFNFSIDIKRMKSVLVIAEHNNETLTPITRNIVTAAKKIGGELTVLVAGTECSNAAKSVSQIKGLKRVVLAENKAFNGFPAENLTPLILSLQKQFSFTHIVAGATIFGKGVLPRVAAKLDVPALTDITDVKDPDVFVRPAYTGNILMTIKVKDPVKIITVRQSNFPPCSLQESSRIRDKLAVVRRAMNIHKPINNRESKFKTVQYLRLKRAAESLTKWQELRGDGAPIRQAPKGDYNLGLTEVIKRDFIKSCRPQLSEAKTIICGGKGIASKKNFELLYDLADKMNAAVGGSKSAVEAGFASKDMYIARNGKVLSPNLYIAIGISGNERDIAALKESKTIIAINKDPHAPIFKVADYGLVGDLFEIIPKLISKLQSKENTPKT